jgi:hypothetical protein
MPQEAFKKTFFLMSLFFTLSPIITYTQNEEKHRVGVIPFHNPFCVDMLGEESAQTSNRSLQTTKMRE